MAGTGDVASRGDAYVAPSGLDRGTYRRAEGDGPRRAAWGALAVLTLINLFNYIDRYVVPAVQESIKRSPMHPSDAQIGMLASAFIIVYFVTAPVFGAYGNRPWRLRLVAAGVAVWSLATAAGGLAQSYASLLGARASVGIGEAAYSAIAPAVLADFFPERLRGRVFGVFYAAIPIGSALGFVIGGNVDHHAGWRAAFFVVGLPGLAAAALTLLLVNPAPGAHDTAPPADAVPRLATDAPIERGPGGLLRLLPEFITDRISSPLRLYLPLLHNSEYVLAVLGYAAYTFGFGGISVWMATFLIRVRHVAEAPATTDLGAIVVVTGFVGTFLGGWIGDTLAKRIRHGYLWLSALSMFPAAPFVYLALTVPSPRIYWPAVAIADFFLFLSTSPINAIIVNEVPPTSRAAAMAASIFTIHLLGDVPSPWLIGQISDRTSLANAVLIIPVAVIVSGAIWTWAAARNPAANAPTPLVSQSL
jgi:MFS transporter, Spinster family, sphingosine-1-phosphate transporter